MSAGLRVALLAESMALAMKTDKWRQPEKAMFILLYLLGYPEWRNTKLIEKERTNIPKVKAHFEHLRVNSCSRVELVHPACVWMGLPTFNLYHMFMFVYSGNSDLNYILHNMIAINKVWKKWRISKEKLFNWIRILMLTSQYYRNNH